MTDIAGDEIGDSAVAEEIQRGVAALEGLRDHPLNLLTVESMGAAIDAVLLARNISKLSPFISTQLEAAAVQVLSEVPGQEGLLWARQDPGFPDAGLMRNGVQLGHGIEAKAWFANATEITGRFKASQTILIGKHVYVVIVAWMMNRVIFGRPVVLDIGIFPAASVAEARDKHYFKPVDYLVEEPQDTRARGAQLQQKNVSGWKCQTTDVTKLNQARLLLGAREWKPPYEEESKVIVEQLRNMLTYREDTNFAKIDRIKHTDIEAFKSKVLGMTHLGRTVAEWTTILNQLSSSTDMVRNAAIALVQKELYAP